MDTMEIETPAAEDCEKSQEVIENQVSEIENKEEDEIASEEIIVTEFDDIEKSQGDTEVENPEVAELHQQIALLEDVIKAQETTIEERNKELQSIQDQMKKIHLNELIQLYQMQLKENEYMREEIERVHSILADKKQTDSDIHQFQENTSHLITNMSDLVSQTNQNHSILNENYTLLQQQFSSFQASSEILLQNASQQIQQRISRDQQQDQQFENITRANQDLVSENQLLKGQLASYEGLIQKKTSENLELQKKLQIIEDEFHRYTALESSRVQSLQEEHARLQEQCKQAGNQQPEELWYKRLHQSILKGVLNDSNVEEGDLEMQVIRLKKEKELLLLNVKSITQELEERLPLFVQQQQTYTTFSQNYKQLLLLWNKFVADSLPQQEPTDVSMQLLQTEVKRQKEENESLQKHVESLEQLVVEFRKILITRNIDIPEIDSIFTNYRVKIAELEKQLEASSTKQRQMQTNNSLLRQNLELLEQKQTCHNEQVELYAQKVKGQQEMISLLRSQLQTVQQQFDQAKLEQFTVLGKLAHQQKAEALTADHERLLESLSQSVDQFKNAVDSAQQAIANCKPMTIVIEPSNHPSSVDKETLFQGVSLSEKMEHLISQKKELEETMQEMEEEANDMNRSIELQEQRAQQLEKENTSLRGQLRQLQTEKQTACGLTPLGNPFNFTSYALNEQLAGLQTAQQELAQALQVEQKEKQMMKARVEELQQLIQTRTVNETAWQACIERLQSTHSEPQVQSLLSQLTIAQLNETSLWNQVQEMEVNKREHAVQVVEIVEKKEEGNVVQSPKEALTLRKSLVQLENAMKLLQEEKKELLQKNDSLEKEVQQFKELEKQQMEEENIEEIEEQFANDVDSVKRERDENTDEVTQKIPKIDNQEMNSA